MYTFEDLDAWKLSRDFRKRISTISRAFPACEKYELKNQIVRSSRSVSANIAEGFGRYYYKENIHFCRVARGSLLETLDHLYVALDEEFIDKETFTELRSELLRCLTVINAYIRYLKKPKK